MEELFLLRREEARSIGELAWVWIRALHDVAAVALGEGMTTMKTTQRGSGMDAWMQDVRYAVRTLGRSPALSLLVVGTLALGIGASTATFSVVNGIMLKPLPYDDPDRLVAVWPEQNFNTAMVRELLAAAPALESASGISGWTFTLTGAGEPLQVDGARVSPAHFRVLGVQPALGRDFLDEEGLPGSDAVAILSHGLWVRAFGGDPDVIGRTVDLATNDHSRRTIVGVLPPDFRPIRGSPEAWIPLVLEPSRGIAADSTWFVNDRVARLAPGATVEQASEQVRAFARHTHALMDQAIEASSVESAEVRPLRAELAGDMGGAIWVALGAVSLVLLIACANVANLLLARGEARRGDLAVRTALGAGRERVLRLLLVESGMLGLLGGALGIGLSYALVEGILRLAPADFPRLGEIGVDGTVLTYGLAATAAATGLAGLVPALRSSRSSEGTSLGDTARSSSARRGSRLTTTLVGAEVALAVLVVIGSGLMLRSLQAMTAEDPGLDGAGVVVLRPSPPEGRYADGSAFHAYYERVLAQVRGLPSVQSASAIHLLPGTQNNWSFPTFVEGVEIAAGQVIPSINFRAVWPEYFETVGVDVLEGRSLAQQDQAEAELAVVVNQAFVDRFWRDVDPLGRELRLFATAADPYRVVGVVENVRQHGLALEPVPEMYFTHAQITWNMAFWVVARVRGEGPPLAHVPAIREAVWSVDPDVPVTGVAELAAVIDESAATTRFLAIVLGSFGALALLLSAVGVFGVTTYGVGRRLPEFGVRVALGASRAEVLRAAMAGSLVAVTAGLGVGLLAASFSTGALSAVLYQIEPSDPVTFIGVAATLFGVAVAAALAPAWRATRVDPIAVLKGE